MYVIPVAYYVVKPDGGLQQTGPRIEVVGNTATLRQGASYYYDQQQQQPQNMAQYQYGGRSMSPSRSQGNLQPAGGYNYGVNNNNNNNYNQQMMAQNYGQWGGYYQQPQQTGYYYPQQQQQPQQQPYAGQQNYQANNMIVPVGRQQPNQVFYRSQPSLHDNRQSKPQQVQQQSATDQLLAHYGSKGGATNAAPPPQQPGSRRQSPSRSRGGSLERRTGEMQIEIPTDSGTSGHGGPLSGGSLPPSYGPSPRHREIREAMEQPVRSPPPRQLFELPWDPKKEPNPPQNVRHVRPQDLVPPEVMAMYSGRRDHPDLQQRLPQQQPQQFGSAENAAEAGGNGHLSRSSSLRRSQQQQHYAEMQRRRELQQQQQPSADLVKSQHLALSNSREHLAPKKPRHPQHYAEPSHHHHQQHQPAETAQLVRHVPPEEAAHLPPAMFEEKPKWHPMRPDKFSIFGKEAAYPPFPVIGPKYMVSVSGGAKLIEILLSIAVLVLVTIICDRGRCFSRQYNPMATEVTMWIVSGCCIVGTVFMCVPYARKKPLSPKAYYRFLLIECYLNGLAAFSYFVASICLLVVQEGEIKGYLIETWVCSAALGFVCGILYVCSTVFSYLALQRAKYYLHFLRYASERHRTDPTGTTYRMSVHPTLPPGNNQPQHGTYNRPPTSGFQSASTTLTKYNN